MQKQQELTKCHAQLFENQSFQLVSKIEHGLLNLLVRIGHGWTLPHVGYGLRMCFIRKKERGQDAQFFLLLDRAPGHFPAFERNSIKVVYFPANLQGENSLVIWELSQH